jgi:CBS domain-containing membrane protein
MDRMTRILHGFGPVIPRPTATEAMRAALGAGVGLLVTGILLYLITPTVSLQNSPLLIAPFAASAVLIYAVPNSPLAQPWAVIVGNSTAALIGLLTIRAYPHALPAAALAVLFTLLATAVLRATHPPAGAAAMASVLAYHPDAPTPLIFALHPVLTGSVLLVATGLLWNRSTGRAYPLRQTPPPPHGTADIRPERRNAPSAETLATALQDLRLGANIGVEDLSRLISAAKTETAAHRLGQTTAETLMSQDLVTARPDTRLPDLVQSFRAHRFKSLPIRTAEGHYAGCVTIDALIGQSDPLLTAQTLADPLIRTAQTTTSVADLIVLLADGQQQTVPILRGTRLAGLVTRSDLIAHLIHHLSQT